MFDDARFTGSVILLLSYGYKVTRVAQDQLLEEAYRSMDNFTEVTVPGAFLVDLIPQCVLRFAQLGSCTHTPRDSRSQCDGCLRGFLALNGSAHWRDTDVTYLSSWITRWRSRSNKWCIFTVVSILILAMTKILSGLRDRFAQPRRESIAACARQKYRRSHQLHCYITRSG